MIIIDCPLSDLQLFTVKAYYTCSVLSNLSVKKTPTWLISWLIDWRLSSATWSSIQCARFTVHIGKPMIISYQLSSQQRHETASFCHSMYRLILVRCKGYFVMRCICSILDGDVVHILYTIKSKQSNVLFSSWKFAFNQNIDLESQHFEFRNWNVRGTNSGEKRKLWV